MTRISPGTVIVLIFAVLFGLVGAYAVREHLKPPEPVAAPPAPQPPAAKYVFVPSASSDLPANRTLTLGDVTIYKLTPEQFKAKSFPSEFMSRPEQIVGRILRRPLNKGDVFQTAALFPEGMAPSVSDRIPAGLKAVTIPVFGTGLLDGLVGSSARVDVMFRTQHAADDDMPQQTVTLVNDVEVLAVDRNLVPGAVNARDSATVTLAVDSQQASALKVAEGRGDFSLALRGPGETLHDVSTHPQTLEVLLNLPRTRFKAEVYRGATKSQLEFKLDPRDRRSPPPTDGQFTNLGVAPR